MKSAVETRRQDAVTAVGEVAELQFDRASCARLVGDEEPGDEGPALEGRRVVLADQSSDIERSEWELSNGCTSKGDDGKNGEAHYHGKR